MIKDDDNSTRIDLGEDLLEKTAILEGIAPSAESPPVIDAQPGVGWLDDQLQSARILLNEGFPEEAKKVLRQILLSDAHQPEARKILEEIHEAELKQMFGTAEPAVRRSFLDSPDESILDADSEEVIRILDRDMNLGLAGNGNGNGNEMGTGIGKELSFFSDRKLLEEFAAKLDAELGSSAKDRSDLAIGFIEMGLYPVAVRLLEPVLSSAEDPPRLNAAALTASALIMEGEPYRAISVLQPVLGDQEIKKPAKTEIFYLMGRAHQALSRFTEAIAWFMQARENVPGYRDCEVRISRCSSDRGHSRGK